MNEKKIKKGILMSALIGSLAMGGISAFFTDADTAVNTFTVGKVAIELSEPSWVPPTEITPKEKIAKDPCVKNTGKNDAYIFAEVEIPYENVTTVSEQGIRNKKTETELFQYEIKDGWIEIGTPVKDKEKGIISHWYAFGTKEAMKALKAEETTSAVFDSVTFANIVEDEGLEGRQLNIVVNAYAVQTANITAGSKDGKDQPEDVWAVLKAQNAVNGTN